VAEGSFFGAYLKGANVLPPKVSALGRRRGAFFLEAADGLAIARSFFDFQRIAGFIERSKSLPCRVQGNVPTRDLRASVAGRDEVHEEAGAAGLALVLTIEVHASERVFENEGCPAGSVGGTAVAAVCQKAKART
jgi:hypothetical protein